MLRHGYRYVFLDVETTGLHHDKDDIIQIWLYEIDHTWSVVSQFQSLVKPLKPLQDLHEVVSYITGFTVQDFAQAPSIYDLEQTILSYFDDRTVIIGHNISFDIQFVQKYFSGLSFADSIDTFVLGSSLIHFAPSYALDILCEHLSKNTSFSLLWNRYHVAIDATYHDALFDCVSSCVLFMYCVQRLCDLSTTFPLVWSLLSTVDSAYFRYIDAYTRTTVTQFGLPPLQKRWKSHKRLMQQDDHIDIHAYNSGDHVYVWDTHCYDVWRRLASSQKTIWVFSHRQKLDIAKSFLQSQGVTDIGYLHPDQRIDTHRLHTFVHKGSFSLSEALFLIKYCSHVSWNIGFLDLRTDDEYAIYYFLAETGKREIAGIVLTTHAWLYAAKDLLHTDYAGYTICYFDADWWHYTYNDFLSRPFDMYHYLGFVEKMLYTYSLCVQTGSERYIAIHNAIASFHNFFQIFIGVLFIEIKHYFTGTAQTYITLDPIIGHSMFRLTNILWDKYMLLYKDIMTIVSERVAEEWTVFHEHFVHILSSVVEVSKVMSTRESFYFTFKQSVQFVSWAEFSQQFQDISIVYFTPLQSNVSHKILGPRSSFDCLYAKDFTDITKLSEKNLSKLFIVCARKDFSLQLFRSFYKAGFHKDHTLCVENITGSMGKNIFIAEHSEKSILIGWYAFLLQCFARKISIDKYVVFFIKWKYEKHILADMSWYGSRPTTTTNS